MGNCSNLGVRSTLSREDGQRPINSLSLQVFLVDTDIDDEALLQFHARHLFLANERERASITDRGLNAYIKVSPYFPFFPHFPSLFSNGSPVSVTCVVLSSVGICPVTM